MANNANMKEGLAVEALFEKQNMHILSAHLSPYMVLRDLRGNATAQAEGFDFTGTLTPELHPAGAGVFKPCVVRMEFKADTNQPVNVCAEYISQVHTKSHRLVPGWLLTSNANWLLYGFIQSRELLVVPMAGFRRYASQRAPTVKATSRFNSKPGYFTYCSLIPIDDIVREVAGAYLFKLGPVEGERTSHRTYSPLAHLGSLLATYPGGILGVGEGQPFDLESYPLGASYRLWQSPEGQKKLCQMLAQLRKNDISARKNEDAHRIEATLYAQMN